ncbi:unnamed protein product [Bursaphelenchus okinawaensis]|uniref:RNA helicase n=1 Tax=Bursaphelenchus okinawaensis TaxID=465554 RepID=A0A811K711_9BILA|nr:unnamed protein product [Bursaphelenchus okinawaensis]CAG9093057.1 unnamed protein product [Bursaphelenchus okinawaensis]
MKRKENTEEEVEGYVNVGDSNALVLSGSKKKKTGESHKLVTSTGEKLDLKKSNKIKEIRQKKEQKLTKNKKRELKRLAERKKEKKTRAELIASLQEFQTSVDVSSKLTSTIAKNSAALNEKIPKFPTKLRANNSTVEAKRSSVVTVHCDTGSSESEDDEDEKGEDNVVAVVKEIKVDTTTVEETDVVKPDLSMITRTAQEKVKEAEEKKIKRSEETKFMRLLSTIKGKKVVVDRDSAIQKQRSLLPIYGEEQLLVENIDENTVTIISGETGSGKTTQIPQFLYEAGYTSNGHLIGVTEPRRVAAMSMAERVGQELNNPDISSYQIRFEGNRSEKTKILFMTDGVLLKELQTDPQLKAYSVIIIDEAHERSIYSDVLIGLLSRIAVQRVKIGTPLKLVIMSATLRTSDFMQPRLFPAELPKLINVESRQFPVTVHFEKKTPDDYITAAYHKVSKIHERLPDGGILVFVSGQKEVHRLVKLLSQTYPPPVQKKNTSEEQGEDDNVDVDFDETGVGECDEDSENEGNEEDEYALAAPKLDHAKKGPLYCLPLYSMMPSHLQHKVFEAPPEGQRLCVIATNVAETSLTIPNIKYVVDTGKEKRRDYDPITGVSQFKVSPISQASASQRSGRAGRVSAGHAYRLYSSAVFEDFPKFPPPEILHKPIDLVVLHLKSMGILKVGNFPFPTQPEKDQLEVAENRLIKLGALELKQGQSVSSITGLGKTILSFPLSPEFGKMVVMANKNNVLPYLVTLISALTVREPMINIASLQGSDNVETQELMVMLMKKRSQWNNSAQTRRLGDLNVFLNAIHTADKKNLDRGGCVQVGLRFEALKEIRKMRRQLTNLINKSLKLEEPLVLDPDVKLPTETQLKLIRQIFVACQQVNVARKLKGKDVPKGAYQTQKLDGFVFIDATSTLFKEEPDFVLYQEIIQLDGQMKMQSVLEVEETWFSTIAKGYVKLKMLPLSQKVGLIRRFISLMPPASVVRRLAPNTQRNIPYILAELQVWAEMSSQEVPPMEPQQWHSYLSLNTLPDRESFLKKLCERKDSNDETPKEEEHEKALLPYLIRGSDFRESVDKTYGSIIWRKLRLKEHNPIISIDCSLLHSLPPTFLTQAMSGINKLVTENWFSEDPFLIHINNFSPDVRVADSAKRHWPFLYGPQGSVNYTPHPLGPNVSSNDVYRTTDIPHDKVIHINSFAKDELTEDHVREGMAFVVNAVSDEKIPKGMRVVPENSFRLPLERHLKWKRGKKSLSPLIVVNIIKDMVQHDMQFYDAMVKNIPKKHVTVEETPKDVEEFVKNTRLEILESSTNILKMQSETTQTSIRPVLQVPGGSEQKRVRVHRYSREERNRRRALGQ